MAKLRSLAFPVAYSANRIKLPPKQVDPQYLTPQYRSWRATVIARADGQCEAMEHGRRCTNAMPEHRMYADHIIELRDGGALLDVDNGQCLCASHHERKTMAMRARRYQR